MSFSVSVYCIPFRKCVTHAIYRDFLALKIEEKIYLIVYTLEPPRVKFKKTKRSNIIYPILPCIRHYIKVGFNGICAAQLQVNLNLRPIQGGISSKLSTRGPMVL